MSSPLQRQNRFQFAFILFCHNNNNKTPRLAHCDAEGLSLEWRGTFIETMLPDHVGARGETFSKLRAEILLIDVPLDQSHAAWKGAD